MIRETYSFSKSVMFMTPFLRHKNLLNNCVVPKEKYLSGDKNKKYRRFFKSFAIKSETSEEH